MTFGECTRVPSLAVWISANSARTFLSASLSRREICAYAYKVGLLSFAVPSRAPWPIRASRELREGGTWPRVFIIQFANTWQKWSLGCSRRWSQRARSPVNLLQTGPTHTTQAVPFIARDIPTPIFRSTHGFRRSGIGAPDYPELMFGFSMRRCELWKQGNLFSPPFSFDAH